MRAPPPQTTLAEVGHTFVRLCCERIHEACASCRSGCNGGSGASGPTQRKRLEELIAEVDEARQENQRLNGETNKLRAALKEAKAASANGGPAGPDGGGDPADHRTNEEREQLQELLRLKRQLWDLQRENRMLQQSLPQAVSSVGGAATGGEHGDGRRVSIQRYQGLQQQVDDLQQALDTATSQADRMRQQRIPPPPPSWLSRGQGANVSGLGGMNFGYCGAPDRASAATSRMTSGAATPLDMHGRGSGAATPMDMRASGAATPISGSSPYHYHPDGCDYDASAQNENEIRRKMLVMQLENEQLKQKVRMLAKS